MAIIITVIITVIITAIITATIIAGGIMVTATVVGGDTGNTLTLDKAAAASCGLFLFRPVRC